MNALSKDARGFVDSVVSFLEDEKKQGAATRVQDLLSRVTVAAKRERNAHVETSVVLTSQEKTQVERILGSLLGHTVDVEYSVDTSVIAGIKIQVADWIVDTSFRGQLVKMQEYLYG